MVDLHTHSTASDGTFSPAELIRKAKDEGLFAVALTDHDTLNGLDEAAAEAEKCRIIFIKGIEISVNWQPGELHLLGLDLQKKSDVLDNLLKELQVERINRGIRIAEKLNKAGFDITYEKIKEFAHTDSIGRPHFAAYMVSRKMVKNVQTAFDKFFAKGRPFFEEKQSANFDEAIYAVKSAGGIPVLAHPMSLYLSWKNLPAAILDFQKRGLTGIEAWNSSMKYNDCKRLEKFAEEAGLLTTAGSDFHGIVRKDRRLGYTSNGIKIDDRFYEHLKMFRY